jgi:transcriptional regulator with XRE-family HTH domain
MRGLAGSFRHRIRYHAGMDVAVFLRERREANGLTQRQLALRAGTSQSAISEIERGEREPSVPTLAGLLRVMGEDLQLRATPTPHRYDRAELDHQLTRSVEERLQDALGWNGFADEIVGVGAVALMKR